MREEKRRWPKARERQYGLGGREERVCGEKNFGVGIRRNFHSSVFSSRRWPAKEGLNCFFFPAHANALSFAHSFSKLGPEARFEMVPKPTTQRKRPAPASGGNGGGAATTTEAAAAARISAAGAAAVAPAPAAAHLPDSAGTSAGGNTNAADTVPPKDRFWCPHPGCRRSFAELW